MEYNLKQERPDREIHDYYEQVKKSKKVKLFYEVVVQFGDLHDCGVGSENWKTAKAMLDEYMREFERRNFALNRRKRINGGTISSRMTLGLTTSRSSL